MLSALYVAQRDVNNEYYFCNNNYGNVGLLWKGANAEKFPPEDLRLQDEPACVQRGPHQRHRAQCHRAGEHRLLPDRDRQRGRENHKLYA